MLGNGTEKSSVGPTPYGMGANSQSPLMREGNKKGGGDENIL